MLVSVLHLGQELSRTMVEEEAGELRTSAGTHPTRSGKRASTANSRGEIGYPCRSLSMRSLRTLGGTSPFGGEDSFNATGAALGAIAKVNASWQELFGTQVANTVKSSIGDAWKGHSLVGRICTLYRRPCLVPTRVLITLY